MAKRKIVMLGDGILREKAKPVTEFNARLGELLDDMIETMFDAKGVGLAAPQVGVLRRVAVVTVDNGEKIYEIVNPVIVKQSGSQIEQEGCLSVPERNGYVERPKKVVIEAQDRDGKPVKIISDDPYLTVAFCHEIDHLDGILYIDKILKDHKVKVKSNKHKGEREV